MMARLPIKNGYRSVIDIIIICHVTKMMTVEENILNNDAIFVDTVDKPKEGVEQQRKQECLRGETSNGKVLGGKRK